MYKFVVAFYHVINVASGHGGSKEFWPMVIGCVLRTAGSSDLKLKFDFNMDLPLFDFPDSDRRANKKRIRIRYNSDKILVMSWIVQYTDSNNVSHWLDPTKLVKKQVKSEYFYLNYKIISSICILLNTPKKKKNVDDANGMIRKLIKVGRLKQWYSGQFYLSMLLFF